MQRNHGRSRVGIVAGAGAMAIALAAAGAVYAGDHDHDGHDHAEHDHGKAEAPEVEGAPGAHECTHDDATASHSFSDIALWETRFENPDRDEWQMPDRVVDAIVDRPDLIIADIGSATGYFPVRFATATPKGTVFGSDIEPAMVRFLNDRAAEEGITNLIGVLAGPFSPHVPRAVDVFFLCNTYHHIDGRISYFDRLKEMLRPGGRVAIVDFRLESSRGPDHKLAPATVEREMAKAGYRLAARHDFLPDQYFLVFESGE